MGLGYGYWGGVQQQQLRPPPFDRRRRSSSSPYTLPSSRGTAGMGLGGGKGAGTAAQAALLAWPGQQPHLAAAWGW